RFSLRDLSALVFFPDQRDRGAERILRRPFYGYSLVADRARIQFYVFLKRKHGGRASAIRLRSTVKVRHLLYKPQSNDPGLRNHPTVFLFYWQTPERTFQRA